jgi:hypothetical protein
MAQCYLEARVVSDRSDLHSTTGVSPSSSESIGSTNDILVKEPSTPYLARHKCGTENTNEEPRDV